jgi:hypothetical protein
VNGANDQDQQGPGKAISESAARVRRGTAGSVASRVMDPPRLCEDVGCSPGSSQQGLGMGVIEGSRTRVDHYPPTKGLGHAENPVTTAMDGPPASRTQAVRMIAGGIRLDPCLQRGERAGC